MEHSCISYNEVTPHAVQNVQFVMAVLVAWTCWRRDLLVVTCYICSLSSLLSLLKANKI